MSESELKVMALTTLDQLASNRRLLMKLATEIRGLVLRVNTISRADDIEDTRRKFEASR